MGDFLLDRELGRGGMGVVYVATQKSMGRKVALKVLPTFAGLDPEAVARFRREAEAAGRLSHPGIVPVFAVGEQDGVHYFAMELVDGPPLSRLLDVLSIRRPEKLKAAFVDEAQVGDDFPHLRQVPGDPAAGNAYHRSCAALIADVANALAAAHRQHVIHRDVKPSNILLHPGGRPVLVDFGLARDERADSLTRSGDQIGTPSYMSPEQARGWRALDARVDIYGLGAVLYEMLTLRPPFESASAAETMRRILEEEPIPVRRRNPLVPADLATIVHTCLAKDPDDRYPVMEALELDLRSFLAGRRIMARAPSIWTRLCSAARRHRRSAAVATGAFLVAGLVAFAAGVVGDSEAVYRGRDALAEARSELVEYCRPDRARDLYGQALALLADPDSVSEARVQDFRDAFRAHYPAGLQALSAFAGSLTGPERQQVGDLLARLEGRGHLTLASRRLAGKVTGVEVRALVDGALEPRWRTVSLDQPLPLGEYLVRLRVEGYAPLLQWAEITRDRGFELRPDLVAEDAIPAGTVQVVDPSGAGSSAVARLEVTRKSYGRWLESLPPQVRREMTPLGWDGGLANEDHPVRGLSYHQARAFAAHMGWHLPTSREHWLAGSGGLRGLRYPWGPTFEPQRIAADPLHMEGTLPADSLPEGASPLGVHHVLGNVAEIGSLYGLSQPVMLGGHFHSERPGDLVLSNEKVPQSSLGSRTRRDPYAGLREYRFLPGPEDTRQRQQAEERRAAVRLVGSASTVHDWRLGRDGRVRYELELNGIHDGSGAVTVPVGTFGFVQAGTLRAWSGHGDPLPVQARRQGRGEAVRAQVTLPASLLPGQGYRLRFRVDLLPASGLLPDGDSYVLSVPIKGGSQVGALHTVRLPPSTRVEEVRPQPTFSYSEDGPVLVWETSRQDRIESVLVRFRADGMLGDRFAFRSEIEPFVGRLLSAWNRGDPDLAAMLADDFRHDPGGTGREAIAGLRDRYSGHELVDVMAIGDVVTADLRADWEVRDRAGGTLRFDDWPLLLQLVRSGDGLAALRLSPKPRSDEGSHTRNGGYRHRRLGARLEPVADSVISRTREGWTEMQVTVIPHRDPDLWVQIAGHYAAAGESPERIRFRLSGGELVLRPGERLRSEEVLDRGAAIGEPLHWVFAEADGSFTRQGWLLVTRGRRHFLIRRVARGATAEQAAARYASEQAQRWFGSVLAGLAIE